MKKIGFIFLSMIPGLGFSKNATESIVRITVKTPEDILIVMPYVQKITGNFGIHRVNVILDSELNSIDVLAHKMVSSDNLVEELKGIFGEDVQIKKLNSDTLALGTQDNVSK